MADKKLHGTEGSLSTENKTHLGSGQHLKERDGKEEKSQDRKVGRSNRTLRQPVKTAGAEAEDSGTEAYIILLKE